MNVLELLLQVGASAELLQIFQGVDVSRYETIEKVDGKSFGIYLYKQDVIAETRLVSEILSYLGVTDKLKHFVLSNYHTTPGNEEFCLHFPLGSNALIRTHTKPTKQEYKKHGGSVLGPLGIKGYTLMNSGEIKDIKYYYCKDLVITTLKYTPSGELVDTLLTDCHVDNHHTPTKITMYRRDGQVYRMYSHHLYDSFVEKGVKGY